MELQVTFKIYQLISLSSHFLKASTKYVHLFADKKFVGMNLDLSKNDQDGGLISENIYRHFPVRFVQTFRTCFSLKVANSQKVFSISSPSSSKRTKLLFANLYAALLFPSIPFHFFFSFFQK